MAVSNMKASFQCDIQRVWEFDMENDNMKGHWTGVFTLLLLYVP